MGCGKETHLRQVIIIFVAAVLIGYDLIYLDGYYVRLAIRESVALWKTIENFVLSLF